MKDNQAKYPQLRFKGFTDPWEQRKFGELYKKNLERNKDHFSSDRTISIATMRFKKEGNGAAENSLVSYKVLREGDIAFEGHTSKRFAFGRFVLNDIGDGIMSPRFTTLRPTQDMPIKFWKQYIHYEPIMRYPIVNSTKLGTMMNELVVDEFLNQPVLVPELSEQQKIGSFFKQLDNTITLHQRKLAKLKELKQGYLQKLFPRNGSKFPQLRFAGFADAWEQRKLGEVADIIGGGTPSTNVSEYWNGDIDWYSPVEIGNQIYIDESQKKITGLGLQKSSAHILPVGTVLFTSRAGIGNTAILAKEGCTNQGFQSIVPYKDLLNSYFIFSRTSELKRYGEINGAGSTFIEVSGKQMAKMPISVPSIEEQQKIGTFFKQLDDTITLHQRKLEKLQELKKGYLQKMFC